MAVVRGDVNYIRIGARSNVQDGSVLHVSRPYPGNDSGWALIAGAARDWFAKSPQRISTLGATGGVVMIGLGVGSLFVGHPGK